MPQDLQTRLANLGDNIRAVPLDLATVCQTSTLRYGSDNGGSIYTTKSLMGTDVQPNRVFVVYESDVAPPRSTAEVKAERDAAREKAAAERRAERAKIKAERDAAREAAKAEKAKVKEAAQAAAAKAAQEAAKPKLRK